MKIGKAILGIGFIAFLMNIVVGLCMMAAGVPHPPAWLFAWVYGAGALMLVGLIWPLIFD